MPRGPHPEDRDLFGESQLDALRLAVRDLSWLLSHGYAEPSALKLVGDRYALRERQRAAVRRSTCTDHSLADRTARRLRATELRGRPLIVDGFNCIIIVESAFSGAPILRGRDDVLRDLASVHGNYRRVQATEEALARLTAALVAARPASVQWLLDRPVSNSGRLRQWLAAAAPQGIPWTIDLPMDADPVLIASESVVASADGTVLDRAGAWVDLADEAIAGITPAPWILDLR